MPTVLRDGPYRVSFYSREPDEPPPGHVDRDNLPAKVWLEPVELARNLGFPSRELRRIIRLIVARQVQLPKASNEYHSAQGR